MKNKIKNPEKNYFNKFLIENTFTKALYTTLLN
jgi:hypothetical protein